MPARRHPLEAIIAYFVAVADSGPLERDEYPAALLALEQAWNGWPRRPWPTLADYCDVLELLVLEAELLEVTHA